MTSISNITIGLLLLCLRLTAQNVHEKIDAILKVDSIDIRVGLYSCRAGDKIDLIQIKKIPGGYFISYSSDDPLINTSQNISQATFQQISELIHDVADQSSNQKSNYHHVFMQTVLPSSPYISTEFRVQAKKMQNKLKNILKLKDK